MNLSAFNYPLSTERIAQYPLPERDSSKLLVVRRNTGELEHRIFRDITGYLHKGDVLVLNDTKVIPVRLNGKKASGGKVELTLLRETGRNVWEALVKGISDGAVFINEKIIANVSRVSGAPAKATFEFPEQNDPDIKDLLHTLGVMPLPPYIKRKSIQSDRANYQTIYARNDGAVAAPTAGLHFTEGVLHAIKERGVNITTVTLHVGYGTFKPIITEDIQRHKMDEEYYEIPQATAEAVNCAKAEGRRVIAVGTTVTRTLESSVSAEGRITPGPGKTSLFIYPGYQFRIVDVLSTNFHQPRSTPVMLTSAFAGLDLLQHAYAEAAQAGYRFFSYGDAMLIL